MTKSRAVGREILFTTDMHLIVKKDKFLSCASNELRFIYELSKLLQQKHFNVIHASGNADVLIVKTAVQFSEDHVTVLVGDDTDLFVLLCYHALPSNKKLYFSPKPKKGGIAMAWDINNVKLAIGDEVSKLLPVANAMLGCDTTSMVYGLGKGLSISKLVDCWNYRAEATVFFRPDALHSDITEAEERAMRILYSAPEGMTLHEYRFKIFSEKVASVG